jgi:hypothetical protein
MSLRVVPNHGRTAPAEDREAVAEMMVKLVRDAKNIGNLSITDSMLALTHSQPGKSLDRSD